MSAHCLQPSSGSFPSPLQIHRPSELSQELQAGLTRLFPSRLFPHSENPPPARGCILSPFLPSFSHQTLPRCCWVLLVFSRLQTRKSGRIFFVSFDRYRNESPVHRLKIPCSLLR